MLNMFPHSTASAPSRAVSVRPLASIRGQALVEYALILALVVIAVVVALSLLAPTINSIFRAIPPAL